MKNLFTTLFFTLVLVQFSFAQKMTVDLKPESAQLYVESIPERSPEKIKLKTSEMAVLGVKEGYITHGYTFGDLKKLNQETFTITLEKFTPLPSDYSSKSLEFKKIKDATGQVEKPDRMGMYGITIKGTELNSPLFMNALTESIADYGYDINKADGMFEEESSDDNTGLALGAELLSFSKDTRGSGFQVSIVVEWSVYSYDEKKVIKTLKTAGYSDTEEEKFNNELAATFKDAIKGLLADDEFQALAKK